MNKRILYILIGVVVVVALIISVSLFVTREPGKPIITSMSKGELKIDTIPSGAVLQLRKEGEKYTDKSHKTPLELELYSGTYYFYCGKAGYLSSGERSFTIKANKTTKEDIKLDSDPAVDIEGDLEK